MVAPGRQTNQGVAAAEVARGLSRLTRRRMLGLAICAAVFALLVVLSLAVGSRQVSLGEVWRALFAYEGTTDHLVIRDLRIPRTILGVLVGAALGVAGTLMQAATRNPLADPGLLGVSAGASLAVVVGMTFWSMTAPSQYVWLAFAGAAVVSVVVYALGSLGRGAATPVRLVLAGAAVAALLTSLTSALLIMDLQALDQFRFWVVGSVADRSMDVVAQVGPFILAGLVCALPLASPLNTIALGDDAARALGTRVGLVRAGTVTGIAVLCGAATAACGPIAFVGLIIPHLARRLCGPDYRWVIPYSALLGAIVLVGCDIISRVVARPAEIPVGITTAFVGGIIFVILVRRTRLAEL